MGARNREGGVIKVRFSVAVDPEVVRRVDQERRYRTDDGKEQSRSSVVQEALELWLELQADEDRERMMRLSDRIEATQDLIQQSTTRLARMIHGAHIKSEMAFQLLQQAAGGVPRDAVRGSAAKMLDSERRRA